MKKYWVRFEGESFEEARENYGDDKYHECIEEGICEAAVNGEGEDFEIFDERNKIVFKGRYPT